MANNDDQMKRFLFAILKQKNLKDIDWNQVAHDPVLTQPITNGHAARMRYSRFRQQMLGLEPQKRNRTGQSSKAKVSKSKNGVKLKKEDGIKSEPELDGYADAQVGDHLASASSTSSPLPPVPSTAAAPAAPPQIKLEQSNQPTKPFQSQFSPTSAPSPSVLDCHSIVAGRMLTPCSDDMMGSVSPDFTTMSPGSSVADLFGNSHHHAHHQAAAFALPTHHDLVTSDDPALGHTHGSWAYSPVHSAFDAALDMSHYDVNMCEHHQSHSQVHSNQPITTAPDAHGGHRAHAMPQTSSQPPPGVMISSSSSSAELHDADAPGEPDDDDAVVIVKREDFERHTRLHG